LRALATAVLLLLAARAQDPAALRVNASPVASPCVAAAGAAFTRATSHPVAVRTGDVEHVGEAASADVVVGADEELTRVIEGGESDPDLDVDVARIPWVLLTPPGTPAASLEALSSGIRRVRVLGGTVGRRARGTMGPLPAGRVETVSPAGERVRVDPGEAAIVPLSLAGPGHVSSLPMRPVVVRAVGVRASPRRDLARAFLDFLVGEGNPVFAACGREDAR
jgi:hypothetical protein